MGNPSLLCHIPAGRRQKLPPTNPKKYLVRHCIWRASVSPYALTGVRALLRQGVSARPPLLTSVGPRCGADIQHHTPAGGNGRHAKVEMGSPHRTRHGYRSDPGRGIK